MRVPFWGNYILHYRYRRHFQEIVVGEGRILHFFGGKILLYRRGKKVGEKDGWGIEEGR